ncbi:MAG: response regulator [Proteiniphilum sp.]|jgi:signal transduction histidine kinase/ligand-binding sensor domain-containing protein/DNA-binding response OmpR family regulator|nr:response regulator [Proteiniphilum sp.]
MRIFLLALAIAVAPEAEAAVSPIIQLGVEHGLSNNYIAGITQDRDGFLWFATEEGLNRFDGTRFINYYKHTSHLSGNELNGIFADPAEPVIWIATQRAGLNAYNYARNTLRVFTHDPETPTSLHTNDVTSLFPAAGGNLWISTYHQGIEYFNKKTEEFTHYNTSSLPGLASDNVWTVMDDGEGHVYIGHVSHGLSILSLKDRQTENFRHDPDNPESIPGNSVKCIYKDSNNNIWVGTDKGLALFNSGTSGFIRLGDRHNPVLSSCIFDVRLMKDNRLWVATELNGVVIIDLKQHFFQSAKQFNMQTYTVGSSKYGLSNPTVRCVFQDRFHNVWLGTYGGGVNFISRFPPLFDSYVFSPVLDDIYSLNNRVALSLCLDGAERVWAGTDGSGVNVFEKGRRVAVYNKEKGDLPHNTIQAIFKDSSGNLWLGSFGGGILCYDHADKKFDRIPLDGSYDYDIRCFFEDADKNIWVGGMSGIFVLDPLSKQVKQRYCAEEGRLPENFVRSIARDDKGRMWIGTFGKGLAVYTPDMKPVYDFSEYNGFCSNAINHIHRDSRGQMWIGTGEGLVCFTDMDSMKYRVCRRGDGLSNAFIRAITEDSKGNIWFSTNTGVSCLLRESGRFYNYSSPDQTTPMGSFTNSAVAKAQNGTVYFGSNNGVWLFDPVEVLKIKEASPVKITELKVFEVKSSADNMFNYTLFDKKDKNIKLTHKQNTVNFRFSIQDYSLAAQVDYACRLKGLTDSWSYIEDNNITFRNIPPGNYEFQVRARIKNQDWPEAVTSLSVLVSPPLWLTWQAKVAYLLFAIYAAYFLLNMYKKRVDFRSSYELEKKSREREQELNNERLRFYTNVAHELRTPLTLILGPLEDLQHDSHLSAGQVHKISLVRQSAFQLLNLINQILEFRKTETQNKKLCVGKGIIANLVIETGLKYKELNMKPDLQFLIETEDDQPALYFDREIVTIILDNLISNAVKYTDRGSITLSLHTSVKNGVSRTEIAVEDTGQGIAPDEQTRIFDRYYQVKNDRRMSGTGIGLALVKNLVKLHEGEIRLESTLNKGSRFVFSLLTHNIYPNALHADEPEEKRVTSLTEEIPEEKTSNGKPVLLVIEDNVDIRKYISDSFSGSFEVITASEGKEGYAAAFSHIPDIVVSDVMMPGMNGIEFCKTIKGDVRTSHIPVILLTAKDSLHDREEGYISGADSYLTKPFSATLLHSRISNLLETRRKLADKITKSIDGKDKSTVFKETLSKLDDDFLQNVTRLIEEGLESDSVNISSLSEKLCMSSSTLFRKIKALTGISTNEFIRKIKMKNAERLLLTGRYTISEISFKVGINSPVYFRECFREEFGISPSEYIRRMKGSDG